MNPMTRVCAERDAWKKDAEQHARSADYYRNLIDDAADQIGEMVFRCDDGSISTWVLPASHRSAGDALTRLEFSSRECMIRRR